MSSFSLHFQLFYCSLCQETVRICPVLILPTSKFLRTPPLSTCTTMARLIRDVMNNAFENPVHPQDIPRDYSFQSVHGRAICRRCNKCKNSWSTNLAWLTIDLRNQRIARAWLQKCKGCNAENQLWFPPDELENMVIHAVERCWKLQDGSYRIKRHNPDDEDDDRPPPHQQSLCERCEYGKRKCWLGGKKD